MASRPSKSILATIVIIVLLIHTMIAGYSKVTIQWTSCDINQEATILEKTFRLLAVEAGSSKCRFQSAESLIQALLEYPNWKNNTYFRSYIELLSFYNETELPDWCEPLYKGNATRDNLQREIKDFLGPASPDETVLFYFDGHNAETNLCLDHTVGVELDDWLPKGCICILDCCDAGWWIDVLGSNRMVLGASKKYGNAYYNPEEPIGWSDFTGTREVLFGNGSRLPVGIIGSREAAQDSNKDGWVSMTECFEYASASTKQFAASYNDTTNPVYANDLGYDPPFVLRGWIHPPIPNFACSNGFKDKPVIFNASTSNGTIVGYTWNFGDGNITKVTKPLIAHTYSCAGNYTVTLNVTDIQRLSQVMKTDINVKLFGDLNGDCIVDLADIWIIARAYASKRGDPRWNLFADMNNNGAIDLDDVELTVKEFGYREMLTDLNFDGKVDIDDAAVAAKAFGSYPSHVRWNIRADINQDNKVDLRDLVLIAKTFGRIYS